jgi:hypothetical protein
MAEREYQRGATIRTNALGMSPSSPTRGAIRGPTMKAHYDFRYGKRGAVIPSPGKTRITIRIDTDLLEWFRDRAEKAGGGNYQTMINEAIRRFKEYEEKELEETLRRVLREELPRYAARTSPKRKGR